MKVLYGKGDSRSHCFFHRVLGRERTMRRTTAVLSTSTDKYSLLDLLAGFCVLHAVQKRRKHGVCKCVRLALVHRVATPPGTAP